MNMKIGIIGSEGVVGSACKFGFEKVGHEVLCHDIKLGTSIKNVLDTEIIFICVPTPSRYDGSCDISIVGSIVEQINKLRYMNDKITNSSDISSDSLSDSPSDQIIAIKSTVAPGTTDLLASKYKYLRFAFVPEFLRERCSISDFTENHDVCIIGTNDELIFEKIKKAHGKLPKKFVQLSPSEAEFAKYFNNGFNAMRVIFANSFYEICKKYSINYTNVKDAVTNINHIPHNYLECNENMRGFSGICLPKDLKVIIKMSEGTCVEFFSDILRENEKYKKTVFKGMRNNE